MQSTVGTMERTGHPYKGILYGQFMNTAGAQKSSNLMPGLVIRRQ